jgi:hypothetical protein
MIRGHDTRGVAPGWIPPRRWRGTVAELSNQQNNSLIMPSQSHFQTSYASNRLGLPAVEIDQRALHIARLRRDHERRKIRNVLGLPQPDDL